jgi:hypothetical protein
VRQAPSTNFTRLSFSSATQRQFAGEPAGLESALAFAAVLVAQCAELPFPIAAQSVRTKQSMPALVVGFDWLFIRHGSPDQPINLLHRLDLRRDNPHLNSL